MPNYEDLSARELTTRLRDRRTMVLPAPGGCWWPIEIAPPWMQTIADLVPTGWTMNALHQLMSFEAGPASILPELALLAGATGLVSWAAVRWFRYE